jgi:hypothetical protein
MSLPTNLLSPSELVATCDELPTDCPLSPSEPVAICDELLTDCLDSQSERLEAIKAYITRQEDKKIAVALVLTHIEAHLVQLDTMTTDLTASRDNYRERLRRFEEGWESCINTMSGIDNPSLSHAGKRPRIVWADEDEA